MTEYAAYFDDSGHPDDQDVVLVAGFLSTEKQWLLFENDWQIILDRAGIDVFHMTDFEASKRWSRAEKDTILLQIGHLIRARMQFYVCSLVPMKDYISVNDVFAFEQFVGTPYTLAGRDVVSAVTEWMERNTPDGKVIFVFDDGTKHKGDFMDSMHGLPTPVFRKKSDVIPLQAADWLAWESFNSFKTNHVRQSVGRVIGVVPGSAGIYYAGDLQEICRELPVPRYSDMQAFPAAKVAYAHLLKKSRRRTIFSRET